MLPPRSTVTFVALTFLVPVAIYATGRLFFQPSIWWLAVLAWLAAAPLLVDALKRTSRRIFVSSQGIEQRRRWEPPRVIRWADVQVFRFLHAGGGREVRYVIINILGGGRELQFEVSPEVFIDFRREVQQRSSSAAIVDGGSGNITHARVPPTLARREREALAAREELPRQWFRLLIPLGLLVWTIAVASKIVRHRGQWPRDKADLIVAVVILVVFAAIAVITLTRQLRLIARLRSSAATTET